MITAQQVAVLFLLIFTGAAATKAGILRSEGKQTLSGLLVNVVVPAMILNSYQMEFSCNGFFFKKSRLNLFISHSQQKRKSSKAK